MAAKILVTGGAGFVGSNLLNKLINLGHDVVSLDDYSMGSAANHVDGVEYVNGHTADIHKFFSEKFQAVYHLGEYSRVEQSFNDVHRVITNNTIGTAEVVKYCLKFKCRLIYAGSSTKFANFSQGDESPYVTTKKCNTLLINNLITAKLLDGVICYFYNVYGKNEISTGEYATVIAKFLAMSRKNQSLPVVAPGTQLRNFTSVNDIVSGLIILLDQGTGDNFMIGSSQALSVIQLAEAIGSPYHFIEPKRGNRLSARIDTSKIEMLGWTAKGDVYDYITQQKNH